MGKKYIKCPRCELNYILEGEDYCHVCQSEMKHHTEADEDDLLDFEEMELCPVCGQNYIKEDQTMCDECRNKKKGRPSDDDSESSNKNWNSDDEEDEEDEDSLVSPVSDIDSGADEYNSGYEIHDGTDDLDPYKTEEDDILGGDSIEFSEEEELDDIEEIEQMKDDFEIVDVSDDEEDDDEEDDDDYDFEDDILGKK